MKRFLTLFILLSLCLNSHAELKLKNIFSDGMVLQQNSKVAIWGSANPGALVTVQGTCTMEIAKCTADADGNWKVYVKTGPGSYIARNLVVKSGKESITVKDVLLGEVWLGSGQSNMEMMMDGQKYGYSDCPVRDAMKYIASAPAREKIRMFSVPRKQTYEVQDDCEGSWKGADSETIPEMSATGYFFARKLNEVLDVPVGIILSAFGGAKVESWMPEDILAGYGDDLSKDKIEKTFFMNRPYMAYNAMLAPLEGYTIKGFIWYQGCSNVAQYEEYPTRLADMVARWRKDWGDDNATLPFYQVEIAPCEGGHPQKEGVSLASLLRQAQHEAAKIIPNGDIITTNDLMDEYEAWNIHPSQKEPVGNRLAYLALHNDYGFTSLPCHSPEAVSAKLRDDKGNISIQFDNLGRTGINRHTGIKALEVQDADGLWHSITEAQYSMFTGGFSINCEGITDPQAVRYGWGDFNPGNLTDVYGLGFVPFYLEISK